ncbi:hypothetical protein PR048_003794 [Dryococelus australis]|uniref:Uncharacterized protein n=1 Tax=Dryococelus australis TaxID=614101 RepID=A0ABQ9IQ58_9NEOP|nr:hypothetical protein PR048_003794 [Dryococelus australis]
MGLPITAAMAFHSFHPPDFLVPGGERGVEGVDKGVGGRNTDVWNGRPSQVVPRDKVWWRRRGLNNRYHVVEVGSACLPPASRAVFDVRCGCEEETEEGGRCVILVPSSSSCVRASERPVPGLRTLEDTDTKQATCQNSVAERLACSPPTSANRVRSPVESLPDFSQVGIVPYDAAGRRVFSAISRFPRPCISALLRSHLISPSSALNTSLLRATQISLLRRLTERRVQPDVGQYREFCTSLRNCFDLMHTFLPDGEVYSGNAGLS